jgi:hypothetical protein
MNNIAGHGGQPRSFVDAHALHSPCVYPCSPASTSTRANVAGAVGPRPSASLRTRMSTHTGTVVSVKIIPNEKGSPPGKLADAEVIFEADAGPLSRMKLIGFSVWERRDGGKNVTCPARQYSVNGARRSVALLVPRPRTVPRKTPFGNASSTRTAASRCHSDGHSSLTRRPGTRPPPGTACVRLHRGSWHSRLPAVPSGVRRDGKEF